MISYYPGGKKKEILEQKHALKMKIIIHYLII